MHSARIACGAGCRPETASRVKNLLCPILQEFKPFKIFKPFKPFKPFELFELLERGTVNRNRSFSPGLPHSGAMGRVSVAGCSLGPAAGSGRIPGCAAITRVPPGKEQTPPMDPRPGQRCRQARTSTSCGWLSW